VSDREKNAPALVPIDFSSPSYRALAWAADMAACKKTEQVVLHVVHDLGEAVIKMCNSGGRITACIAKFISDDLASQFKAFYEIDRAGEEYLHPKHKIHLAGLGGFQGSVYNGIYNGYSGFAGRPTDKQLVQGWAEGMPPGRTVGYLSISPRHPAICMPCLLLHKWIDQVLKDDKSFLSSSLSHYGT
jgi:hypothetical protein